MLIFKPNIRALRNRQSEDAKMWKKIIDAFIPQNNHF